jgi:hypothetical protein
MPRQNAPAGARSLHLWLLGIALLSAVPLTYLALTRRIEFDDYWNAFVALQDRWSNLVAEYQANPHPPLYYLLLRATLWFGRSHLAYRASSMLAEVGTVYLVGLAASRLTRSRVEAVLAALAYGLAMPTLLVAIEVRGYMVCTFFILLSYCYLLRTWTLEEPAGTLRWRAAFALSAVLGVLSDYYSFFYAGAVLAAACLVALVRRPGSRVKALAGELATFAPVLAAMALLFVSHTESQLRLWPHLRRFFYGGGEPESPMAFVLRNLQSDFDYLSPWWIENRAIFLAILTGLLAVGAATVWMVRRIREPKNLPAAATVVVTVLILAELAWVGLTDKYPFGGELRHQFLLFPFLVLCGFVFLDRLAARLPRKAAGALAAAAVAGILVVGYFWFGAYPGESEKLMTRQMERFDDLFPASAAVYVDRFNLYAFFLHHDDWQWTYQGPALFTSNVDVYRVSRGRRKILVLRDKLRWLLEYDDEALYIDLAAAMRSEDLPAMDVFHVSPLEDQPREASELREYRKRAAAAAEEHGLCLQQLTIHNGDGYAELRPGRCEAGTGGFDGTVIR